MTTQNFSLICAPFLSLVHPANCGSKLSARKGTCSLITSHPLRCPHSLDTTVLYPFLVQQFVMGWLRARRRICSGGMQSLCHFSQETGGLLTSELLTNFASRGPALQSLEALPIRLSADMMQSMKMSESGIMKEMVETQADQVCYSEINESLPLFEAYRAPNGTLLRCPVC